MILCLFLCFHAPFFGGFTESVANLAFARARHRSRPGPGFTSIISVFGRTMEVTVVVSDGVAHGQRLVIRAPAGYLDNV